MAFFLAFLNSYLYQIISPNYKILSYSMTFTFLLSLIDYWQPLPYLVPFLTK
jgi:hypothetical protein